MPDDNTPNPLDALISSTLGNSQTPGLPDTSSLPVSSSGVPQPPQVPQQQPQTQDSGGYRGPRPILMDLIQGLRTPPQRAPEVGPGGVLGPPRPVSRAAVFEDFLGNFVGALGQGFAASGHGPGAFGRGFGAAVGAPLQMQQQQQQFASEQAQRQAQTQMTQEQAAALPAQRAAQLAALSAQHDLTRKRAPTLAT